MVRAAVPRGPVRSPGGRLGPDPEGRDTLIAAPTGSGKTLSGFLVAIDALYRAHAGGAEIAESTRVVYVSPLKALAVDIHENLERPLAEIAAVAEELGLDPPAVTVGVRTRDTPASARTAMVTHPPNFLVTTPESLYRLVTAQWSRRTLAEVETAIVDEIHALARDKRGSHLALTSNGWTTPPTPAMPPTRRRRGDEAHGVARAGPKDWAVCHPAAD